MYPEHTYILECPECGTQSEQDARDVDSGLVVECCGRYMAQAGESYTDEWAKRQNRRNRERR